MLVTILLFKIKVVLCVITHHHRHRFEKKIIRSEREVNADREFPSTTAEEDHVRRWKKQTHISLLLVVVKTRVKEDINVRQKERESIFRTFSMAWSPYGIPADIITRAFLLFYREGARVV